MITIHVKKLTGFNKIIGLINTNEPKPIFLTTRYGIHTFGLKYPIDILILNKTQQIVKLRRKLPPNRIFLWNPRYNKVLELPHGYIAKNNCKVGTPIKLIAV